MGRKRGSRRRGGGEATSGTSSDAHPAASAAEQDQDHTTATAGAGAARGGQQDPRGPRPTASRRKRGRGAGRGGGGGGGDESDTSSLSGSSPDGSFLSAHSSSSTPSGDQSSKTKTTTSPLGGGRSAAQIGSISSQSHGGEGGGSEFGRGSEHIISVGAAEAATDAPVAEATEQAAAVETAAKSAAEAAGTEVEQEEAHKVGMEEAHREEDKTSSGFIRTPSRTSSGEAEGTGVTLDQSRRIAPRAPEQAADDAAQLASTTPVASSPLPHADAQTFDDGPGEGIGAGSDVVTAQGVEHLRGNIAPVKRGTEPASSGSREAWHAAPGLAPNAETAGVGSRGTVSPTMPVPMSQHSQQQPPQQPPMQYPYGAMTNPPSPPYKLPPGYGVSPYQYVQSQPPDFSRGEGGGHLRAFGSSPFTNPYLPGQTQQYNTPNPAAYDASIVSSAPSSMLPPRHTPPGAVSDFGNESPNAAAMPDSDQQLRQFQDQMGPVVDEVHRLQQVNLDAAQAAVEQEDEIARLKRELQTAQDDLYVRQQRLEEQQQQQQTSPGVVTSITDQTGTAMSDAPSSSTGPEGPHSEHAEPPDDGSNVATKSTPPEGGSITSTTEDAASSPNVDTTYRPTIYGPREEYGVPPLDHGHTMSVMAKVITNPADLAAGTTYYNTVPFRLKTVAAAIISAASLKGDTMSFAQMKASVTERATALQRTIRIVASNETEFDLFDHVAPASEAELTTMLGVYNSAKTQVHEYTYNPDKPEVRPTDGDGNPINSPTTKLSPSGDVIEISPKDESTLRRLVRPYNPDGPTQDKIMKVIADLFMTKGRFNSNSVSADTKMIATVDSLLHLTGTTAVSFGVVNLATFGWFCDARRASTISTTMSAMPLLHDSTNLSDDPATASSMYDQPPASATMVTPDHLSDG